MIRLIAQGGLGNQLFVWNYAHELHLEHGMKIAVVFSGKIDTNRAIYLKDVAQYCSHDIRIRQSSILFWLFRKLDEAKCKWPRTMSFLLKQLRIITLQSPEEVLGKISNKTLILRGYFQNSKSVFLNHKSYQIELESWLDNCVGLSTKELVRQFKDYNAIHIRRGDFQHAKSTTGILSFEYFTRLTDPSLKTIIVTDDVLAIPKIEEYFPTALVLNPQDVPPPDAMFILVNATSLVTSNSTFSWWAAVIGATKIRSIYMPKPWNVVPINDPDYLNLPYVNFAKALFDK